MSPAAREIIEKATAQMWQVVEADGLLVADDGKPTAAQVRIAAIRARQDAALCAMLLGALLEQKHADGGRVRTARVFWWAGVILAVPTIGVGLLLCWAIAYVLGGRFWLPP